ncbi:MAG: family efflux transporter [Anaerocolumna sp.]|jgi:putative MATE family efflux protein|nr:family efflux transporter [Anaerocolumna sp.]
MTKNMTVGNTWKHLISFAIPMILGNLFQLTYNAVDSIIVGRFAGENALAAVGTANPIMNIIIFFIIGICMGASVLMSEFYGAGEVNKLKKEIATTISIGSIFTILITFICFLLVKPILKLIHTPNEILTDATTYLRIIFLGLIFTFLYNVFAATLRSIGDSKTPIYFLMISAVINAGLDYIFIAKFHYGVVGAAYATIIAEAVSSILCIGYTYIKVPMLRLKYSDLHFERSMALKTISYSWYTSMQQTVLYVGKVMVQSAVNPLGISAIATFNAVNRVDDFAFMPEQSISHSMTTFIAQNRGAKQDERIKNGFRVGMRIETIYWGILFLVVFFGATSIMKLFVTDKDISVVTLGTNYLQAMAFFYLLPAYTNGIQGYFRGMGKLNVTLAATVIQMITRVLFSYILAPSLGIKGIAYACFLGWTAMLLFEVPFYFWFQWKNRNAQ